MTGRTPEGENLEIESIMSSINSPDKSRYRVPKERGIPTKSRCGEGDVLFTSKTWENLGRLFHCCLMGYEKDKPHLFKWTDKSVVEEIEDFQEVVDVVLIDNIQFQNSMRASEILLKRHESRIGDMEDAIARCQAKTIECSSELRIIKALFVCCLVMVFIYLAYPDCLLLITLLFYFSFK
ncbi:unnamed protein product [Eruca vesicaria subsp. sativa]|uniref:Uncharacterized protein n=1 Tax=Eruca vesicaria subsp. sativa TaxID=29727 RepID=A0ABC8LBZ7_ERUVS|nr:unnamed protein product [Eruca vesicaria subsp. sativa]